MLELLQEAERELPSILNNVSDWKSLYIDYHPPVVERLSIPWWDGYRLSLHKIHPCSREEALYHPHPWPAAGKIIRGRYETAVGFGPGTEPPPMASRFTLFPGAVWEMTEPDAWHYVRPLVEPVYTWMISGVPWIKESPTPSKPLRFLTAQEAGDLLAVFVREYCFNPSPWYFAGNHLD